MFNIDLVNHRERIKFLKQNWRMECVLRFIRCLTLYSILGSISNYFSGNWFIYLITTVSIVFLLLTYYWTVDALVKLITYAAQHLKVNIVHQEGRNF